MATCFLICAIGQKGTETRMNADDLLEEIETALEPFGITPMRGDHNIDTKEIDSDVIERIQNAELCIADLSEENVNVYYELGRRDETGRPIILIKRRGTGPLPADIASRRYIEYDIDSRRGAREFRSVLREAVQAESSSGFEGTKGDATLAGVLEVLMRVERKIDRMGKGAPTHHGGGGEGRPTTPEGDLGGLDPTDALNLALRTRNVPLAESAMDRLQWTMETNQFYDIVVEQVCVLGSQRATQMLFDYAEVFFDSDMSFRKKIEYLGALVGAANRYDREPEIKELVERVVDQLDHEAAQPGSNVEPELRARAYNQLNRLNYGIYANTQDTTYLNRAIDALNKALSLYEAPYMYYNMAVCQRDIDLLAAREAIDRCLAISGDNLDDDHLELACKIYRDMGDPGYGDLLERLSEISPMKAQLIALE